MLSLNQRNVANAINTYFNTGGALPPGFVSLFGLSGPGLGTALSSLSGEAATGAQQAAIKLTSQFLLLMLDPHATGPGGAGAPALGFAPEQPAGVPPEAQRAYASVLKAPPAADLAPSWSAPSWSVWGTGFGGRNTTTGDAAAGTNTVTTSTYGFAAGIDRRVSPDTRVGFALAGSGTGWGLAQGLGSGRSDAFQAGLYGKSWFGPGYVAAAVTVANHWMSTTRTAAFGNQLEASFEGRSYGGRLEAGWRLAASPTFGVTPYAAVQAQRFDAPAYRENDLNGGGFGLAYNATTATDTRSELGARLDEMVRLGGIPVVLRGRAAWAHDWTTDPSIGATFQSLPGAGFTVNGATPARDSALVSAGADLLLGPGWSLAAKFEGEFAAGSHTLAGTGTLRYAW